MIDGWKSSSKVLNCEGFTYVATFGDEPQKFSSSNGFTYMVSYSYLLYVKYMHVRNLPGYVYFAYYTCGQGYIWICP